MVIQVYAPTSNAEEPEFEQFYEGLQNLLEHPKRCPFHYRGLECKSRKPRNTWSNRQICLGVRNEAGLRRKEFCKNRSRRYLEDVAGIHRKLYKKDLHNQDNPLVIANTLFHQQKRRLYTWTSPDGQYQNQTDYILCSQSWRKYAVSNTKTWS